MHIDCLREDVLNRVHGRLYADQPHVAALKIHRTGAKTGTERQSAKALPVGVAIADEQSAEKASRHIKVARRSSPRISQFVRRTRNISTENTGHQHKSDTRPPLELLHATLLMRDGPMLWEIKVSRPDLTSNAQTWSKAVFCLLCSAKIE